VKNSSRFIIVILLLAFSWWLQDLLDSKPELITREKTRFANYYLQDFKLTAHDTQGKEKYILQAERLQFFEQDSVSEIDKIRAEFFSKESNWIITADKANLYKEQDRIEFLKNVKIFRPKQKNRSAFTFHTDKISLLTEKEILETSSLVTVSSDSTVIKSKGLRYDNQQGILEFKSDVKVTYVR